MLKVSPNESYLSKKQILNKRMSMENSQVKEDGYLFSSNSLIF